jgi:hypothetical protein
MPQARRPYLLNPTSLRRVWLAAEAEKTEQREH